LIWFKLNPKLAAKRTKEQPQTIELPLGDHLSKFSFLIYLSFSMACPIYLYDLCEFLVYSYFVIYPMTFIVIIFIKTLYDFLENKVESKKRTRK